jgi:hypothetical protein
MRVTGLTALAAVGALVAGCGGSGAPDVNGAPASDSATLFKAANLNKVLTQAKSQLGGTPVTLLKIEPRDVKIIGQSKTVTVDANGNSASVSTPTIPGQPTFDLAVVSPATVESVVNAVESKGNLKQSQIGYVTATVDPISNKPGYGVYPVSGTGHYQANINGGNLKSYGGASGASASGASPGSAAAAGGAAPSAPAAPSGGNPAGGGGNPQAIANCVSQAGGDPAKIQKCTGG